MSMLRELSFDATKVSFYDERKDKFRRSVLFFAGFSILTHL